MTPLRIGILGAARIADDGIVHPAAVLGHELVAVAARDRGRAETFAAARGIARVHDSYADVIGDPEVEVVYNALVNSEHAKWNIAALRAGKTVLSEKPLTSNADQARAARMDAADLVVVGPDGHQALDVAAPHRLVELELDVVGRSEGGSGRLGSGHDFFFG